MITDDAKSVHSV